jgi:hypothetical protein
MRTNGLGMVQNKFCYEVDIEVDITESTYMGYSGSKYSANYDLGRGSKRYK